MAAAKSPDYKYVRQIWDEKDLAQAVLQASPVIGLMPKDESFSEEGRHITVGYGGPQGIAGTYEGAKAAKRASKAAKFYVQHKHRHATFSVDGFLLRQAEFGKNRTVLLDVIERESEGIVEGVKRQLGLEIHGNGGASLGRLTASAAITTDTLALLNASDARNFETGMLVETASTDGTSGTVNPGYFEIEGVQYLDTGSQLISLANANVGVPAIAVSDWLFRADTFGSAMSGIGAYLPNWSLSSLPGTLNGLDRNVNPRRLAGTVIDCSSKSPKQTVLHSARVTSDNGKSIPDLFICTSAFWEDLANELQTAGALTEHKVPAEKIGGFNFGVSYDGIAVRGPRGPIMVVADPDMPANTAWCLTKKTWCLLSMGPLVHWNHFNKGRNDNGGGMLEDGADSVEFRLVSDHELVCKNPFANSRVITSA